MYIHKVQVHPPPYVTKLADKHFCRYFEFVHELISKIVDWQYAELPFSSASSAVLCIVYVCNMWDIYRKASTRRPPPPHPPRISAPFIENHRPKTKNYITEGAKKKSLT